MMSLFVSILYRGLAVPGPDKGLRAYELTSGPNLRPQHRDEERDPAIAAYVTMSPPHGIVIPTSSYVAVWWSLMDWWLC